MGTVSSRFFTQIFLTKGKQMSRQIQIRRGTAAEHTNFTGAIGESTMDTTNKTIRVHDGETPGGTILAKQSEVPEMGTADYVIQWQNPTAENNYTWYRKYKSGWVEQGGITETSGGSTRKSIVFPIEMADTHYISIVSLVAGLPYAQPGQNFGVDDDRTTTGMGIYTGNTASAAWCVKGIAAI